MSRFSKFLSWIYMGGQMILLVVIAILSYPYVKPRLEILNNPPLPRIVDEATIIRNSDVYIETVMETITLASLGLFLFLMVLSNTSIFENLNSKFGIRSSASTIVLGILVTNLILISWTLYTDPRGYYGTGDFRPRVPENRNLVITRYNELPVSPELVVFGSSHANTIDPAYAKEISGLTTFNASVQGGTPEYGLAFFKYLAQDDAKAFPPVIFFEVSPTLASFQSMRWLPLPLIPNTRATTMRFIVEDRLTSYLNLQQVAEGVLVYQSQTKYGIPPQIRVGKYGSTLRLAVENPMSEEMFNQIIERDIRSRGVPTCPNNKLDPVGHESIENLVKLANEQNATLIFYVNPNHPAFYEARIRNRRLVEACYTIFNTFFNALVEQNMHVYYLDYSDITSIGGDVTRDGYYDSHHLTWRNNDRLLDTALPTIQQAYQTAQQMRNSHR